jgi:hypothetical protein
MDNEIVEKIRSLNLLKDHSYTPKNVVLVTVDDVLELFHELAPYAMSRREAWEEELLSHLKEHRL